MPSPASTIPLSLALAGWWLPVLGLLLAGLGATLVAVAVEDLVAPVRATRSIAGAMVAVEPIAGRAVLTDPVGRGTGAGAGEIVHLAPGRRERPANCLGADLATGRRAESTHLATVPLLHPAECGDLRDVIRGMAALPHTVPAAASGPSSWSRVDTPQIEGIDLVAAALYGPPDRQPQAKRKEEEVMDGGRGRARNYLEETAASRVLVSQSLAPRTTRPRGRAGRMRPTSRMERAVVEGPMDFSAVSVTAGSDTRRRMHHA